VVVKFGKDKGEGTFPDISGEKNLCRPGPMASLTKHLLSGLFYSILRYYFCGSFYHQILLPPA